MPLRGCLHNTPKETDQIFKFYFIMFVLFRIFDITKPFPVSYYDKNFKNSFGVIMDDVCAGLYVASYSCFIYDFYMKTISQKIVRLLKKKKLKISFAESCTGGILSSAITSVKRIF